MIVLISESMLRRSRVVDGRLLRDTVLCGLCVRMNARKRAFRIATSVAGKQFRMCEVEGRGSAIQKCFSGTDSQLAMTTLDYGSRLFE